MHHPFVSFCLAWFQPNTKLSICRALIILIDLGTHPSNMGEELLYYHLYHEDASFYMDVHPQMFNRPFIIFKV